MKLVDTHAHLHFEQYSNDYGQVIRDAYAHEVGAIICVGTSVADSKAAINFVSQAAVGPRLYATAGIHPHEAATDSMTDLIKLVKSDLSQIIAIGECGLDYYRNLAPANTQKQVLKAQIDLAVELDLPVIFHVRDAWDDFFEIIGDYPNIRGVIHSFTGVAAA